MGASFLPSPLCDNKRTKQLERFKMKTNGNMVIVAIEEPNKAICEMSAEYASHINKAKYKAIPILDWLSSLNK